MASAPRRPSSRTSRTLSCLSPLLLGLALAAASPVRFDQRQNGSVNVQVDLKDLEVFAIVEDEQLEGAVAQAVESVRPSSDVQESLKGPLPDAIALPAAPAAPPAAVGGSAGANGAMQSTSNAPRRPNDKLAAIKHKTGGLLPHERSDAAPLELPPWDAAAARGEEVADDSQEEEDLEPRSTTAVEARAAPAPPAPVPAGSSPVAPPPPGTRPTQSQGVRPAGTVSVAHLHCGLGYYRDQTGRCRRARRPSSSNTRKHHHGTRRHRPAPVQGGAKPAAAAPAATPVSEPVKDLPSKESSVKQAAPVTKDTATKTSAPKQDAIVSDSKESVKEATPISGTPAKDPVGESASPVPAASPLAVAAKPAVKEAVKEPVKEALKEVVKEPVSAHKAQPVKQAPAKQAAAVKVPVQDRIASSGHKASSTVSGNVNVKEAVKMQPVQLKAPPKPPLREAPGVKPQRQQPNKPVAAAVKDKEAPKVSHHHGQHKITVIKEDTKPRSPPAPVKVAVKAASPTAVAAPATPVKKN